LLSTSEPELVAKTAFKHSPAAATTLTLFEKYNV